MRNRYDAEALPLSTVFAACEVRRKSDDINHNNNDARSPVQKKAYGLARRLSAAWAALKSGAAKRGGQ